MTNLFLEERNAAIRASGGNLVSLDILTIDPAYQRRGAGGKLVEYGTGIADKLGVEAVVTDEGGGVSTKRSGLYSFGERKLAVEVLIRV